MYELEVITNNKLLALNMVMINPLANPRIWTVSHHKHDRDPWGRKTKIAKGIDYSCLIEQIITMEIWLWLRWKMQHLTWLWSSQKLKFYKLRATKSQRNNLLVIIIVERTGIWCHIWPICSIAPVVIPDFVIKLLLELRMLCKVLFSSHGAELALFKYITRC